MANSNRIPDDRLGGCVHAVQHFFQRLHAALLHAIESATQRSVTIELVWVYLSDGMAWNESRLAVATANRSFLEGDL